MKFPPKGMHHRGIAQHIRGLEDLLGTNLDFGFNIILDHNRFLHAGQTYLHERTRTVRIYAAASPVYLTPFFTQVPCAVAKKRPAFHNVTRTFEFCDSQLKS